MKIQDAIGRLRERTHVPLLVSEVWDAELDARLQAVGAVELFAGLKVQDPYMAGCAVAGLHLWNDNFQSSHNLCQGIDTPTGSYWHCLNHRREGHQGEGLASNLSNAKYWARRVGDHPAYDLVYRSALSVLDSTGSGFHWATEAADVIRSRRGWDPNAMIDWVAQVEARALSAQSEEILAEIQWREMDLLVDWCMRKAAGE